MPEFRRYNVPGACYLVTTTVVGRSAIFRDRSLCLLLVQSLDFYRKRMGFKLLGYVIMPDHLHLIVQTNERTIAEVMRNFKSYTGKRIGVRLNEGGGCWQQRYHDSLLRSESSLLSALDYVHDNPVAAGLVEHPGDYELSSFLWYNSGTGPLTMDSLDA